MVVKAGHLLDVKTGQYQNNVSILIENGIVKSMGANVQAPAGARVVDLSNATVLPGLVDAHVHLTMEPANFGLRELTVSPEREALQGARMRASR